ncbi:type I-E CRISPR-associated protein Cas6/Cse3/CasE [Microbacterium trichothecenolyticum]|uniref:CRISPR system Cascade subunit CasE n=1 Tax=Microbacterium trichothecenolyticum TaxID=69370 RepID=A0ABU0TW18_MICTR|nr:type I-E CRISPR-associated protein Cas6/Cse3/CasE [Microbacterium trichothecenolyticum]MDQ1123858.1 CRISPR system Cascade subunit CasE [Microbacterium trichothecenolyticum]
MFLSRVRLNPARRSSRPVLASPHVLHAAVLAAFPDPSPRATGRVLWRLDTDATSATVYVVSPEQPDFTHLVEQAGWPSLPEGWIVRPYGPLLSRITQGQHYRFRLTANPVRSTRSPESESGARGKVFGHVTVAQQTDWLLSRAERLGFAIARTSAGHDTDERPLVPAPHLSVTNSGTVSFSRRETRVTLRVATYEGLLEVTSPEDFRRTLTHGIGRAKGYGCGLLTIAPAS